MDEMHDWVMEALCESLDVAPTRAAASSSVSGALIATRDALKQWIKVKCSFSSPYAKLCAVFAVRARAAH